MEHQILFFWFELCKIDPNVVQYLPYEFYTDINFVKKLCTIENININPKILYDLNILPDNLNIKSYLYRSNPVYYMSLLTEELVLYIINDKQRGVAEYQFIRMISNGFDYLLPEILKIDYRLYFFVPIEFRTRELFNIIVPKLHTLFNCDETLIQLDYFYDKPKITKFSDFCYLELPPLNIIKHYVSKDITNVRCLPYIIDWSFILPHIISKLKLEYVTEDMSKYLTIDMCDIIVKNSVNNKYTYCIDIVDYIPLNLISTKSAELLLANELPDSDCVSCPLYDLISKENFIKICTCEGLCFILDKEYHTYEIYYNFMLKSSKRNVSFSLDYHKLFNINFELLDDVLLKYFVSICPGLIFNTESYILFSSYTIISAIELYILHILDTYDVYSPISFRLDILLNNADSRYMLEYLGYLEYFKYKFPCLELYINDNIPLDRFNELIYSGSIDLSKNIIIINKILNNYSADDRSRIIKYLISNNVCYSMINKKYHTLDIFTLCSNKKPYIQKYGLPDEINNCETWKQLFASDIIDYNTIPFKYKNSIELLYYSKLLNFEIKSESEITIDLFYKLLQTNRNAGIIAEFYSKYELSSYTKWKEILYSYPDIL